MASAELKKRTSESDAHLSRIALGEDSTRQFKINVTNGDALAAEMAAFANSDGGTIY
jgi:ATP-dependent DNA helicase RecG